VFFVIQDNFGVGAKGKRQISVHVLSKAAGGAGKNVSDSDRALALELDARRVSTILSFRHC
jgi:hypothetical protein